MHELIRDARALSDADLVAGLVALRASEREATARVVAHLAEVERRELHLAHGFSSLFAYCQRSLGYSESECYGRIEAARCVRAFPFALELLLDGAITMTTLGLLRPHLTDENHRPVLESARGRTKVEVEILVAHLRPRPDVPVSLRAVAASLPPAVPAPRTTPQVAPAAPEIPLLVTPAPVLAPLAPERFRYQLTIDEETRTLLTRAREMSAVTDAELLKRALGLLVVQLERNKYAKTEKPLTVPRPSHPDARGAAAHARRQARARAGGQCEFVGRTGIRCTERRHLEFHHTDPWAAGGEGSAEKIEIRCRRHNQYEARLFFERDVDGAPRLERPMRPNSAPMAHPVQTQLAKAP